MKLPLRFAIICVACALPLGACCSWQAGAQVGNESRSTDRRPLGTSNGRLRQSTAETVVIPGPLRSFLRMAGISQQISPEEVMPMLARNVSLYGFQTGREDEFLVLLNRYVHLAREIQAPDRRLLV